jgi:hypothetical protein
MNRQHGSHGQIKMDPTGGATAVLVASMSAWNMSMARDHVDVTSFGDTNKISVLGLPDYKGTLGGWFDTDDTSIFDAAMGNVAVMLELIPTSLVPLIMWSGLAWLDAAIDVKATGAISMTGNWSAAGPWTAALTGTLTKAA